MPQAPTIASAPARTRPKRRLTQGEEPENKRKNLWPASIGLSVLVPKETRSLEATVRFAEYVLEIEKPEGGGRGHVLGLYACHDDRLIATAEYLRKKLNYRGYLHLKMMPGTEYDQVLRALQLADRVSVNLEGPNTRRLAALAPQKGFLEELIKPLQWV